MPINVEGNMLRVFAFALAALAAGAIAARDSARPDPADPKAKVPPTAYRPALEGYRPYAEQDVASWREANDEAARSPGHGSPDAQGGGTDKPAAKAPTQPEHGGHK